jgi:acyl-coenzyme A synthetase/AMP-(fatty) acid ligase
LEAFFRSAERHSACVALIDGTGQAVTFGAMLAQSARLAKLWRGAGLGAGDRVVLAMPLGLDLYISLASLWRLGAIAVFPEPALGMSGLRHAIRVTRPRAFLASGWYRALKWALPELWRVPLSLSADCDDQRRVLEEPALPASARHPALISFTSGSTGEPKSILRTHGFLMAQNATIAAFLQPQRDGLIDLVAFPMFALVNLGLGVTSVLPDWSVRHPDKARPAAIRCLIERHGIARALIPPSICEKLCAAPPRGLDVIFTGGGPIFPDVLQRLNRHLPDTNIVMVYGSTEAEPIAQIGFADISSSDWSAMSTGAGLLAGKPVPQINLRILDDEIIVTGEHVSKGYLDARHDAATKLALDGAIWHRTGDAGRIDVQGRLWLLGRKDGRIGGFYPFSVESVGRSWPGVRAAALAERAGSAVLAVEGDDACLAMWRQRALELGELEVCAVKAIPRDRRHRSKVDYPALQCLLDSRL